MKAALAGLAFAFCIGHGLPAVAADDQIGVVAAENFYGDMASQIGGDHVEVTSIL